MALFCLTINDFAYNQSLTLNFGSLVFIIIVHRYTCQKYRLNHVLPESLVFIHARILFLVSLLFGAL